MKAVTRPLAAAILLGLALAGFVPVSAAAQDDPVLYVVADVVKLRQGPSREATVVANLRIDTPVRPVEGEAVPEGWAKVESVAGNETGPFAAGYVASAFLSAERPSADALLDRHRAQMAAGDLDGARNSAERLVALEPASLDHVERLRGLYERLGHEEGVARLTTYLRGDGVKYVAYCGGGFSGAVLLFEYRPGEGIVSRQAYAFEQEREANPGPLIRLGRPLQRSPWFRLGPGGTGTGSLALSGTWALAPELATVSGGNDALAEVRLRLGACSVSGTVYSNEPMRAVESAPLDLDRAGEMIRAIPVSSERGEYAIDSVWGHHLADGPGLRSIQFDVGKRIWGLFDGATDALLAHVGDYTAADYYSTVRRVTWFRWELSPERVFIVESANYSDQVGGQAGISVYVVDEENRIVERVTER